MTTTRANELTRRGPRRSRRLTLAGDLSWRAITYALELGAGKEITVDRVQWPSPKYRDNPVLFAEEILGVVLWQFQKDFLNACVTTRRVAVAGGRKIGKDFVCAVLILWWFCTRPRARVVMTATTAKQVDDILWSEVKRLYREAGKCLACKKADPHDMSIARPCPHSQIIDGDINEKAGTGLKGPGDRFVNGLVAREAEGAAGVSRGPSLLYIIDEASGVSDEQHRAIRGNFAGGGTEVLISNPTRSEGFFFDAFHKHKEQSPPLYFTMQVSSRTTPNYVTGRMVFEGLAMRDWVDEEEREYGRDSPFVKMHVNGEFVLAEDGKIVTVHQIEQAIARYEDTKGEGRLFIGLDPAGPGGFGDESAFAARRGKKVVDLQAARGLTADAHLVWLLGFIAKNKRKGDLKPIVLLDASGDVGSKVRNVLAAHGDRDFEFVPVMPGADPMRQKAIFFKHRDELYQNLADWLRDGGAIPDDARLRKDLHAASWDTSGNNKKMKATHKREIVKQLGRSPDRGDAVMLACWEPAFYRMSGGERPAEDDDDVPAAGAISPYEGTIEPWNGGLSPYAGGAGHDSDD